MGGPGQVAPEAEGQVLRTTELPPSAESVGRVRRFVRESLTTIGVAEPAIDSAVLLASELATNAVLHARTPFHVLVTRPDEADVTVAVRDLGPLLPTLRPMVDLQTTGRGLRLVDTLATAWGVEATDDGGKSVWFSVAVEETAEDAALEAQYAAAGRPWLPELGGE